jgi:threonine aldolase
MPRSFASDNNAGVHPGIMQALQDCNTDHVVGYGDDIYTRKAIATIKNLFTTDPEMFFVYGGTAANVLAISSACKPFESVICAQSAHINVDECGAPERFSGCKLIPVPTENGKLTSDLIKPHLHGFDFEHHSQPRLISISQPTEMGTVYTMDELKALRKTADEYDLLIHMDGARIANAAVYLNRSFKEILEDGGADVVSFGGNKNGLMFGEALLIFNKQIAQNFKYIRKQAMQLHSKMRFISAQFEAYISKEIWKTNAVHSNKMTQLLLEKVKQFDSVQITQPVQTNALFARIPKEAIARIKQESFFYTWNENTGEVRWMTAFDTTEEDIAGFVRILQKYLK